MASIITSNYRTDSATLFKNDVAANDYYIFVSSLEKETVDNTAFSKTRFLEKTIFGKAIPPENVFYSIPNNPWSPNVVYDAYDDKVNLEDKNFYVVVYPENNDTGSYLIFKCLFNNYGAESIDAPNFIVDNVEQIYRTADGYVWKFMYALSTIDFDKYLTLGNLPIISDPSNTSIQDSQINVINVENNNENVGYEEITGSVLFVQDGTITITGASLSEITNFYSGRSFYVINFFNSGNVYEINSYTYNPINGQGILTIKNYVADSILVPGSTFSILPRVIVEGDGEGCIAIPILEDSAIVRILVLNPGSGYTNAIARVIDPLSFNPEAQGSFDTRAILRPILSPPGGHSSDIKKELLSKRLIVYTELTLSDNENVLPTSNKYSKVGLVKNPTFKNSNTSIDVFDNRMELELDSTEGFSVGDTATQVVASEITFSGVVHEVSNTTIYLTDYMGPFTNYVDANTNIETDISFDPDVGITSPSGQLFSINNATLSNYVQKTGDVYFMIDFDPVERTAESDEEYKILLEF
jgi:hypothetical protein